MASPTKEQVLKYEYEHKVLFISLVIANNLWLAMPGKYGFDPKNKNTEKYKSWIKLGTSIANKVGKWAGRQYKLEQVPDGKVTKIPKETYSYFFKKDKVKALSDLAMSMIKPGTTQGIGFIPLLIWGVIAIAGFFTVSYIVDETTTTAQEKSDLLKDTEQTLKNLNIPPEEAAKIISQTQKEASSNTGLFGGGGMLIPIGLGIAAIFLLSSRNKSTT